MIDQKTATLNQVEIAAQYKRNAVEELSNFIDQLAAVLRVACENKRSLCLKSGKVNVTFEPKASGKYKFEFFYSRSGGVTACHVLTQSTKPYESVEAFADISTPEWIAEVVRTIDKEADAFAVATTRWKHALSKLDAKS